MKMPLSASWVATALIAGIVIGLVPILSTLDNCPRTAMTTSAPSPFLAALDNCERGKHL